MPRFYSGIVKPFSNKATTPGEEVKNPPRKPLEKSEKPEKPKETAE